MGCTEKSKKEDKNMVNACIYPTYVKIFGLATGITQG